MFTTRVVTAGAVAALSLGLLGAPAATAAGAPSARTPSGWLPVAAPAFGVTTDGVAPVAATETTASFTLSLTPAARHTRDALAAAPTHGVDRRAALDALTPPASEEQAVLRWAAGAGLRVVHASRFLVTVAGPAAALAGRLGTTVAARPFHGRAYPVRTGAPHVPAALAGVVAQVSGLDNRPLFSHRDIPGGFDGDQAQHIDGLPNTNRGQGFGENIATVNLSGWTASDLFTYANHYGYPVSNAQLDQVQVDGAPVVGDSATPGGGVEVALDSEAILGVLPNATQHLYFDNPTGTGYLDDLDAIRADVASKHILAVSSSWGNCEAHSGDTSALDTAIANLVATGATFFAASGDSGAYGCSSSATPDNSLAVDFPASDPHTVAVGGTDAGQSSDGSYTATGWGPATVSAPDSTFQGDASGGGVSGIYPQPSYQAGVAGTDPQHRSVPDVANAADAARSPFVGFAAEANSSGPIALGGTSLAAPLTAAGDVAMLQSAGDYMMGAGNLLPVFYAHPAAFLDVTANTNFAYAAGPGYDKVTGLGVPVWSKIGPLLYPCTSNVASSTSCPRYSPHALPTQQPVRSLSPTLPVSGGASGQHYAWLLVEGTASGRCNVATSLGALNPTVTLRSSDADGVHPVLLDELTPDGQCFTTTGSVLLDRVAPTFSSAAVRYVGTTAPTVALSWGGSADASPSSGFGHWHVRITDTTRNAVVAVLDTAQAGATYTGSPGHTYTAQVSVVDRAGNSSAARTLAFRAPYDDRSLTLAGSWSRHYNSQDYAGSHLDSTTRGATASFRFTGTSIRAGVLRCAGCGYVDVLVDGHLLSRLSLYASSTQFRYPEALWSSARGGTHTLTLRVDGAHQAGATGTHVLLDSLSVT